MKPTNHFDNLICSTLFSIRAGSVDQNKVVDSVTERQWSFKVRD